MTAKFDPKAVFSTPVTYESGVIAPRAAKISGLDDVIERLTEDLHFIFQPALTNRWSETHYKKQIPLVQLLDDLVPLIIFEGDVGTGKTEVAETIGSYVAKKYKYEVQMVKMSTQVRGSGFVGEMTTLLSQSFDHVKTLAQKTGLPIVLVIDEADSLLTSRASAGQHHEDKAGVNTILQHLDSLKKAKLQIAVIAISNRYGALDPALKRRATANFKFERPNKEQRKALFTKTLDGAGLSDKDINILVENSGERKCPSGSTVAFSYADLTLRFMLPELRFAVAKNEKISLKSLLARLEILQPSSQLVE